MVHVREQTYHSTGVGLKLLSFASKEVSFLPSKPGANMISGDEHMPKSGFEELTLRLVPLFGGVEPVAEGDIEVEVV